MGQVFHSNEINGAKNYRVQEASYDGYAVTPSDTVDLPNGPTNALYVTGAGNVAVNLYDGGTATLTGLAAGQIVEINAARVLATGTTATGVSALYRN